MVGYQEAVMGTMPRHRLLAPRLRVLITCFPGSLWKDERHQERMEYAKARLGYYRRRDTRPLCRPVPADLQRGAVEAYRQLLLPAGLRACLYGAGRYLSHDYALFSAAKGYTMARAALWRWTLQTRILWTRRRFA